MLCMHGVAYVMQHAVARLITLRERLKKEPSASEFDDLVCQINAIMLMLLKQHVFVDMCASSHEDSVVSKLICLTKSAQKLKDATVRKDVCEELQSVMSACLNSTLLDSAYTPLPCNGMSTHDKIEHIRSSLTLVL
jgi:hypothetical protein